MICRENREETRPGGPSLEVGDEEEVEMGLR